MCMNFVPLHKKWAVILTSHRYLTVTPVGGAVKRCGGSGIKWQSHQVVGDIADRIRRRPGGSGLALAAAQAWSGW